MLRVVYGGSPQVAATILELLLRDSEMSKATPDEQYEIVGVITNPPTTRGRHSALVPTEVEQYARTWNEARGTDIKILCPEHVCAPEREILASLKPDIFICFAYGHILGPKFFSLFKYGGINIHPSILPKYRGATPINECILNMDEETGCSIQKMALGMDEGDIISCHRYRLTGNENAEYLLRQCSVYGTAMFTQYLRQISRTGILPPAAPQVGEPTYCTKIKKEDGKINWKDSAEKIDAMIRAYTPWPGCFAMSNGLQLRILKGRAASKIAAQDPGVPKNTSAVPGTVLDYNKHRGILIQTGDGIRIATELQWQSKKAMDYKSFMNGARNFIGTVLE